MNNLEQLHLDAITQADYDLEDEVPNYVEFASKSAEITEQIAVEFANFYVSYCNKHGQTHSEEVFQEFLKTKQ